MIDDVAYTPTLDALHTVFSTYGFVQRMTVFERGGNWQVCGVAVDVSLLCVASARLATFLFAHSAPTQRHQNHPQPIFPLLSLRPDGHRCPIAAVADPVCR